MIVIPVQNSDFVAGTFTSHMKICTSSSFEILIDKGECLT